MWGVSTMCDVSTIPIWWGLALREAGIEEKMKT
jgi:hypothetical protein